MKNLIYFFCVIDIFSMLLFSGCTHAIRRDGYELNKSNSNDCSIQLLKDVSINEEVDTVLGRIQLKDTGFTFACGEDDAIEILKREGCSIGADAVIIISEKRPDFLSSCYRANAVFIKHRTAGIKTPYDGVSQSLDSASVQKRVDADHKRNATIAVTSVVCGLVGGLLAGLSVALLSNNQ
jgi:hypothetical protein